MFGQGDGAQHSARGSRAPQVSRQELILLAVLVIVGGVARFGSLGLQSFWFDEATTGYVVALPGIGDVLQMVTDTESTPPLYYLVTWGFAKVAGQGDIALRAVSAAAGTAVIPIAWAAARRLADARAGLVAAAFVAFSPLLINYSQEARAYELLTLLCAASFLLVLIATESGRPAVLAGWAAVSAAALATHYFAAFLLVPEAVYLLWFSQSRRPAAVAVALVGAAGAALLPLALEQRSHGATDWISDASLGSRVEDAAQQFSKGVAAAPGSGLGALAVVLLLTACILVALAPAERRRAAAIPLGVGAASVLLPLTFAVVGADVFLFRNIQGGWPVLAIGLAVGLSWRRAGLAVAGGLCLVWAAIWVGILRDDAFHRDDWQGAAESLGSPSENRALLITPGYAGAPLARYGHFAAPVEEAPVRVSDLVVVGVWDSRTAGPRLGRLRLIGRRQVQHIGIARYRSSKPVSLSQAQFAPQGASVATPRLYLEAGR